MGIESDQLSMSEHIAAGTVHTAGRHHIKSSGYYADDGRYPDNRTTWAHGDVLTTEVRSSEQLTAAVMGMKIEGNQQVTYIKEAATYKSTLSDGIAASQTAGSLSLLGEAEG